MFEGFKKRKYEDNKEEKGEKKNKTMKRSESWKRKEVTWCSHVAASKIKERKDLMLINWGLQHKIWVNLHKKNPS